MHQSKTALLVFSLSAQKDASRKYLIPHNYQTSLFLQKRLINQTTALVNETDLDVIWFDESRQKGSTFSERFTHAFATVFEEGYHQIISIGSDCPALTKEGILLAKEELDHGNAVLGPSHDGGLYLIGLSKEQFEQISLLSLPWLKNCLCKELFNELIYRSIRVKFLTKLSDIDSIDDLKIYLKKNPKSAFSIDVLSRLRIFPFRIQNFCLRPQSRPHSSQVLRGPPAVYT